MEETSDRCPTNAIGFDLEHWHSATLLKEHVDDPTDHLAESVSIVCDLLRRHDTRATFFVVGELAADYPELVKRIRAEGHEIGSHGHTHTPLFDLTRRSFERELREAHEAIRAATGVEPIGFRAPNFSITHRTAWALESLAASEYRYDSSVFPVRTPMYGVLGAPNQPYTVSPTSEFRRTAGRETEGELVEFPLSVADRRFPLPIAGGFYGRVIPFPILKHSIRRLNERGLPANLYFHPWELNPSVKTEEPPAHKRLVSFYGIGKLEKKIETLLSTFEFGAVEDVLVEQGLLEERHTQRAETPVQHE